MTRRRRRVTQAAAAVAVALVAALAPMTPATADVTTQYFANDDNGSDPFVFKCTHPSYGYGWCMVTTEDLELQPSNGNYYPMNRLRGYWSADGRRWDWLQTPITESQLAVAGAASANHLWAPAVEPYDTNDYVLYVPALTNANNQLSSRIFVAQSANPISGYGNNVLGQVTGAPAGLYMSDPDVFRDLDGNRYLLWADGDNGTCGGISIRRMTSRTSIQPFTNPADVAITINGIGALGNCGGTGHPYIEGATLYRFLGGDGFHQQPGGYPGGTNGYTLLMSVKPTSTPAQCGAAGQPGTANEVIAYATATSVTGPYTYRGIIMCGSESEWTNQASITEVQAANGDWRPMLVYHDGWDPLDHDNVRSRRMHSECLYTRSGQFLNVMRSPDGAVRFPWGEREWCLQASTVVSIKSLENGKFVSSDSGGVMRASKSAFGTWEEFSLEGTLPAVGGSGTMYLRARHPDLWVQANRNNDTVMARGQSSGTWERFTIFRISTNNYALRDSEGRWVYTDTVDGGRLKTAATGSSTPPSPTKYYFEIYQLTT